MADGEARRIEFSAAIGVLAAACGHGDVDGLIVGLEFASVGRNPIEVVVAFAAGACAHGGLADDFAFDVQTECGSISAPSIVAVVSALSAVFDLVVDSVFVHKAVVYQDRKSTRLNSSH